MAIYLDHNATAPMLSEVVEAMSEASDPRLANPSSLHAAGRAARALLESSRERLIERLGGRGGQLIFTSSGSEANALAVLGALGPRRLFPGAGASADARPRAVVGAIEHPSTLDVFRRLEASGSLEVAWIAPGAGGRVSPRQIRDALDERTAIVSLMHVNNETGVIQDVHGVSKITAARGIAFHCDAVQSLGKLPLELGRLGADLVTLSAHKIGGPRGVGALWLARPAAESGFRPPFGGGPQERGLRGGTENLGGAVGFARAVEIAASPDALPDAGLRDRLWERIREAVPDVALNGAEGFRVPNTLNVSFPGVRSELLLVRLDMEGVQASSGSACSSGAREPSHVLRAMGLSDERVQGAVRFSLGRGVSVDDVDRAGEVIARCVAALRA